jgi:threonine dehydrogenase-like Zn-dependent dehydrogenase
VCLDIEEIMAVNGAQSESSNGGSKRKRVVVVGLGMIGIVFM